MNQSEHRSKYVTSTKLYMWLHLSTKISNYLTSELTYTRLAKLG